MSVDISLYRCVFTKNITHNLGVMAKEAGLYKALWRPEDLDVYYAEDLIDTLTDGLQQLKAQPEYYKQFNPENGWGNYEGLVEFVEEYLKWCIMFPECIIKVSR